MKKAITICSLIMMGIGCSGQPHTPAPVVELYQGKTFRDYKADTFSANKYQVKKGDTLFSIAWFSGNDYRDLARINNIAKPYYIYPGQIIRLNNLPSEKARTVTKSPGQTRKIKVKQTVDRPNKQAYGGSQGPILPTKEPQQSHDFPTKVALWVWPSEGRIVERFSLKEQGNKGLDIVSRVRSPVLAAADGKVVYTGNALRGFGNLVIVKHTDAYLSAYAHNDKILVSEQDWVKAGQKIALMGSSDSSKVMLHFEIRHKGKSVDPLRYLPSK